MNMFAWRFRLLETKQRQNCWKAPPCALIPHSSTQESAELHFQRWSNAFIRPSTEPEVWTDRNNYPAWGLVETGPEEQ